MQNKLFIDIETYCSRNLSEVGLYRYAEDETFEVLLLAYAYANEPVSVIDLTQTDLPQSLVQDIISNDIIKVAHNAAFERVCLSRLLGVDGYLPAYSWLCTMSMAAQQGWPMALGQVCEAMGLPEDKAKMAVGRNLIKYFCIPCKPTRANNQRIRNLPEHDADKWALFKAYCARDVESERDIYKRLSGNTTAMPSWERGVYLRDQEINDRGIAVDTDFADKAIRVAKQSSEDIESRLQGITGLANPKSNRQMAEWVAGQMGTDKVSLNKQAVAGMLSASPEHVREVLALRADATKTSLVKYQTMLDSACKDGRLRGQLQYYGTHTGRWAGRGVQLQNLPHTLDRHLAETRAIVKTEDYEDITMLYDSVPDVLAGLIRTALVPAKGRRFIVADYSAIEARVIAWLAGEQWRMETFAYNGDIYCASASRMFGVPVVKHGQNGHLRAKGKIAELALGYGGGRDALKRMGGERMGLSDAEMERIVVSWREASPAIVRLWADIERMVRTAYASYEDRRHEWSVLWLAGGRCCCKAAVIGRTLWLRLPSGRHLAYQSIAIDGRDITYNHLSQTSRKWEHVKTYGGRLAENIVQSVSRDILAYAMLRMDAAGLSIVAHVHDEVIIEADDNQSIDDVIGIMRRGPVWATGLVLNAEGYEADFYRKD